jgi:hypothetical protein
MRHILFTLILLGGLMPTLYAQTCPPGQSVVRLEIDPDSYEYEVSWELVEPNTNTVLGGGVPAGELFQTYTYCVPDFICLVFRMEDSYGDGMAPNGVYRLFVNDVLIRESIGENYGYLQTTTFNCPPGLSCESALTVSLGSHQTLVGEASTWYAFTPDSTGTYEINTCATSACPTKIWVYEACGGVVTNTNLGTLFYSDGGCSGGPQAVLTAHLAGQDTYYIRVGDATLNGTCNNQPIDFSINYLGPVVGCTDPLACNYNPLATVSDTCIYPGNPDCPFGPDLVMDQEMLRTSLYQGFMANADGCAVEEGCIRGFGNRDLIEFSTRIYNIGELDYYIGQTPSDPTITTDQFFFDACHGHWHYVGYADYILYDAQGVQIPIGSKTGFCVLDLECSGGGSGQYGCSNMGISAGCGDIYSAGLPCQWVDITDLTPGFYTLVVRVNWDQTPDKLGRIEKTYDNNWAQACFNLSYLPNGNAEVDFVNDCEPFVDCLGVAFGNAQPDCEGICAGSSIHGDWNRDTARTEIDVNAYLQAALTDTSAVTACRELHENGHLDVYDAALLQECVLHANEPAHWGNSFPCQFPTGMTNPKDIVYFLPGAVDTVAQTFDVEIVNPYNKILGYEFTINGLVIDSIENLHDAFDADLRFLNNRIIALAPTDAPIAKNILPSPVLRIHYSERTAYNVCIDSIIAVVNDKYQRSNALIPEDNCSVLAVSSTRNPFSGNIEVIAMPNPSAGDISLFFSNPDNLPTDITLLSMQGTVVRNFNQIRDESITFDRQQLPAGAYQFIIRNEQGIAKGRIVWQ